MEKSKVYFTDMHIPNADYSVLKKLKKLINSADFESIDFKNKYVAVKLNFGEPGNTAYLRPNFAKAVCDYIKELGGKPFVTDCNTLYIGGRNNGLNHLDSAYTNGYNPFTTGVHTIIADGIKGTDDVNVPLENCEYVKEAKIGRAIMDADIIISLNHFKGHEIAGFGGAIKNLGMGCGSRAGKMEMHSAGKPVVNQKSCIGCGQCAKVCAHDAPKIENKKCTINHDKCLGCGRCIGVCPVDAVMPAFDEAGDVMNCKMAEYTLAVCQDRPHFHISLAIDITPFCDCHSGSDMAVVPDVGMFASFDPVAIDIACADKVNSQPALDGSLLAEHGHKHNDHFKDISPDTNWKSQLEHGEKIGLGTMDYELVTV